MGAFVEANDGVVHRHMTNVVVHPAKPNLLFTAAAMGSPRIWDEEPRGADTHVYRSEDQGRTWERLTGGRPGPHHGRVRAICGDENDPDTVLVGLVDGTVWATHDSGDKWELVVEGLPPVNGMSLQSR